MDEPTLILVTRVTKISEGCDPETGSCGPDFLCSPDGSCGPGEGPTDPPDPPISCGPDLD